MTSYCSQCGKELQDGQVCDCMNTQGQSQQPASGAQGSWNMGAQQPAQGTPPQGGQMPPQYTPQPAPIGVFFHKLGAELLELIKSPSKAMEGGKGSLPNLFVFVGVQLLMTILFFIFLAISPVARLGSIFIPSLGFLMVFKSVIFNIITFAILPLLALLWCKLILGNHPVSLRGLYVNFAKASIPMTVCMFLAMIFAAFLPSWSLVLFLVGYIASAMYGCVAVRGAVGETQTDRMLWICTLTYVSQLIAIFILLAVIM